MDSKDSELIDRFVKKVKKEIPNIQAAVLYGSIAREDYDRRSDIDIMLIIDHENPAEFTSTISKMITKLRPHREIRTVLTNLQDYDKDYYQNVFQEGRVLFGKVILAPENIGLKPCMLISYDLSGKPNSLQVKISKMVHGYSSKKMIDGKEKIYKYPNIEEKYGGKIVSKSALILSFPNGNRFKKELRQLKVPFKEIKIWM
jgi:predicted nucleotidyltransferase